MGIVVNLDVMLARRKMRLTELSEKVGVTVGARSGTVEQLRAGSRVVRRVRRVRCVLGQPQRGRVLLDRRTRVNEGYVAKGAGLKLS